MANPTQKEMKKKGKLDLNLNLRRELVEREPPQKLRERERVNVVMMGFKGKPGLCFYLIRLDF